MISIVVPVLDEAPTLHSTLEALRPLCAAGHEVIVVDGGSRDPTVEVATRLAEQVLLAPRGRAVQMNVGASVARGDVLLFLHADCRLPAQAAETIEESVSAGSRWGRFDVMLEGRAPLLPVVAALMNARSAITGICTGDQGMFVQRLLFERLGGFPAIPLMEDVALSKALNDDAGPPARLRARMAVSARRWETQGTWHTIATMWRLRYRYWRGTDPRELARSYHGRAAARSPALLVFAKPPVPGKVKTRLAASLGNEAALHAYRTLVLQTLAMASAAKRAGVLGEVEVCAAPEDLPGELVPWCERYGFSLRSQRGDDLGLRMHTALKEALARGTGALLIGTDVPGYDIAYLAQAAWALQNHDAVFGPAEDGGYVLAGLSRDVAAFDAIAWSTSSVMAATRARLAAAGATWHELPTLWDVDTHADFVRWEGMTRAGSNRGAGTLA